MNSLRLWTRLLKRIGQINLLKCSSVSHISYESKSIIIQRVYCYRRGLHSIFEKHNKLMVTSNRYVTTSSSPVEGTSQNNNSRLEKLATRLNADISRLRRVYKSDVEHLLQELQDAGGQQNKQEVGMLLLQCCGNLLPDEHPTLRISLVQEVWQTLQNLGVSFSVEHYNRLLTSYIENGFRIQAAEFLAKMGDVKPNEMAYQLLLASVCESGDIEQAIDVVSRMKSEDFPVSEAIFNSLILGHARAGDLISAAAVLDTMHTAHVPPTVHTYTALMKGYIEVGEMANMYKVHQEAEAANIFLSVPQLMDIVKSAAVSGNQNLIPEILKLVPEGSIDLIPVVINMAVHLVHLGYEKGAYYLLHAVPLDSRFVTEEDSYSFGAFVIREMIRANRPGESIIEICDSLAADGRNTRALLKAAEISLSMGRAELALTLLKALKDRGTLIRTHYFWPIFLSLSKQSGEQGVLSVLDHMAHLGVKVDFDTVVDYILPYMSRGDPESVIRKLQACGLLLGELLTPVVAVLLKENQIKTALQLCRRFQSSLDADRILHHLADAYMSCGDIASSVGLLQVITSSSTKENNDWAGQFILEILISTKNGNKNVVPILKAFQEKGIAISSFAGEVISKYIKRSETDEDALKNIQNMVESLIHSGLNISSSELFSQHIPHPRDMSVEELECHLIELKSKNLNTRGVLRRLLQLYCRQGNVEKALEIKKEFEAANYEFSAGMQASLFDLHVKLGRLDDAELALADLQKTVPNFFLDDHKILDFAALLVANNKYRGAVAILQKQAGLQGVKGGPTVVRNCWKILQAIAEKGEPQKVKHMLELLVTLGYCEISNILLGPVVRAHLVQGSLLGAVREYKHCASEFRKTPLQHELLCHLITVTEKPDDEAAQLLEEVIESTRRVHGAANTNVALAVAFAETGKTKQLKRMVMESSVSLKSSVLMTRCKRLAEEGKLTTLKNLADVSRGIQNFDSSALYTLLLKVYSQRGDCDGALSVWTTLQEKDIRPSDAFLMILASLLRSNKREVPFVVPSDVKRL